MLRRYGLMVLFFAVLLVPLVLRRFMVHAQPASSGGLRLVIITPDNQDIRREFARAFDRWHREKYHIGVTIDYRTPGGTNDIERQLRGTYAGYRGRDGNLPADVPADIDILFGGGDYSFNQLKTAGLLQPMHLDPMLLHTAFPAPALAGVRLYDNNVDVNGAPAPRWVGACLSGFGIIYNPDLYQSLHLQPPTTWHDLTDPRLNGFIGLADPSHSGSVGAAMMMVLQRAMADAEQQLFAKEPAIKAMAPAERRKNAEYQAAIARGWKRGMCDLTLIAANARYFTDSAETVPTDVSRGEAAAGMAIDFYAHITEAVVGRARARFVLPAHATAITPDPVAILTGVKGERLELAMHFIEFLLSKQGQLLWALPVGVPDGPMVRALSRPPIRQDLYADRHGWESLGNPFTEAGNFNQRGEWMALFTDCQMIWVAAWIDSRDAMTRAYASALSEPDPSARATLLARFSDLPIEMSDVAAMNVQRTSQPPEQLDLWLARERIRWARRFREHYQSLEEER
jgi:ABC-type Fe3+ transport system substrate-binding protein